MVRVRRAWIVGPLVMSWLACCTGCETPGRRATFRDDVVEIHQYLMRPPWLKREDGRIGGLRVRTYFVPAARHWNDNPKGVFVSGSFVCRLYVLHQARDGTFKREMVHEWPFDPGRADAFRVAKPSNMGESYGLYLLWPESLDLTAQQVQLEVVYTRADGRVVTYRGNRLRVPAPSSIPLDQWQAYESTTRPPPASSPAPDAGRR